MPFLTTSLFDLQQTLDSGQLFRYWKTDHGFIVAHHTRVFTIGQNGNKITFSGIPRKVLVHFLRLDENHATTLKHIGKDPFIRKTFVHCKGLRILRQDPWECSLSFICSSLSNIKRIRQNIELLSSKHGTQTDTVPLFPTQQQLPERISIRAGFREKYLAKAKNILTKDFFDELRQLPYAEAKKQLMTVPGIGSKVADCILLFSLDRLEAFPVDVWIKRVMEEQYLKKPTPARSVEEFGRTYFGTSAGYAQQYLYHYRRNIHAKA